MTRGLQRAACSDFHAVVPIVSERRRGSNATYSHVHNSGMTGARAAAGDGVVGCPFATGKRGSALTRMENNKPKQYQAKVAVKLHRCAVLWLLQLSSVAHTQPYPPAHACFILPASLLFCLLQRRVCRNVAQGERCHQCHLCSCCKKCKMTEPDSGKHEVPQIATEGSIPTCSMFSMGCTNPSSQAMEAIIRPVGNQPWSFC